MQDRDKEKTSASTHLGISSNSVANAGPEVSYRGHRYRSDRQRPGAVDPRKRNRKARL